MAFNNDFIDDFHTEYAAEHILHVVHGHIHARSFRYAVYSTACIQQYDFLVSHQLCHGTVSIVFESESRSIYIIDECLQTCRDGQIPQRECKHEYIRERKSTRLNSSHVAS